LIGGSYKAKPLETLADEIIRFHSLSEDASRRLGNESPLQVIGEEQLLQVPSSDVMRHTGQLHCYADWRVRPRISSSRIFAMIISGQISQPGRAGCSGPIASDSDDRQQIHLK